MRVLEKDGLLVFKWNEDQIRFSEILKVFGQKPLLGDQRVKTRSVIFLYLYLFGCSNLTKFSLISDTISKESF